MILLNSSYSISGALILYEIVYLILYNTGIMKNVNYDLISWCLFLNFFIIFIMFFTDCNISFKLLASLTLIKVLLLFLILRVSQKSLKYYLIGLLVLIVYYYISDINKIYSCNIKRIELMQSVVVSTIMYFLITLN